MIVRAALLALALLAGPARAQTPEAVELTLAQAHHLAQQAYAAGDYAFAYALAQRLLEADPNDARALLVITATAPRLGDAAGGRRAGRRAWAAAKDTPLMRYEIARHTARAALVEGRPEAARLWLRRAYDLAPDAAAAAMTADDVRRLRARQPFRWRLNVSLTPSSNVNGGAASDTLVVNDILPVGRLSGTAQALSGLRGTADLRLAWRLGAADAPRPAELSLRAYTTLTRLSAEARALAPGARGSDFDMQVVEAALAAQLGPAGSRRPLGLTLAAGHSRFGGEALGNHLRAELSWPLVLRQRWGLAAGLSAERQWRAGGPVDATALRLDAGWLLGDDARLTLAADLRRTRGEAVNTDLDSWSLGVGFEPGRPLGQVELAVAARLGGRDSDFWVLGPFGVPDGRHDRSASLSVQARLTGMSVLGYAPSVTLFAERTGSNISRYETRNIGLSLGLASRF